VIPPGTLDAASRQCYADGIKILQGYRLADTDEGHVAALLDWIAPTACSTWLDIGCGFGEVARLMHRQRPGMDFILLNNNAYQLSQAPREFQQINADMHAIPLWNGAVDGCLLLYTLCHAEPFEGVLLEAARLTRPGGQLLVFDYDRLAGDNIALQATLFARAIPFAAEMAGIADDCGWDVAAHDHPSGSDAVFRRAFGDDAAYERIFQDLRPVIWTAVRR
jgi:ubiquinone/menaquinone biosynthesis C-methylase UbiE